MNFLKKYLSFETKINILLWLQKFKKNGFKSEYNLSKSTNKVIVFLAADYSNLGDVAITYAQEEFIKSHLKDFTLIEIPISRTLEGIYFVKSILNKNDIITTVGGGNFGDLYEQIESLRQLVIKNFPNNKIISFPQTFDFSETEKGKKHLEKAKKVYLKHNKLYFFVREEKSLELMKKNFLGLNVQLTPDIVLSLNKTLPAERRNGITLSLREDDEKLMSNDQKKEIESWAKQKFQNVTYYDTHINKGNLNYKSRIKELNSIWQQYRKSELVITDRLHGMIFCYITNTPAIVFLNNNHKVEYSYKWIKNNSNIRILNSFNISNLDDTFEKIYSELKGYQNLNDNFTALVKALN